VANIGVPKQRGALAKNDTLDGALDESGYLKGSIRAKVKHPFVTIQQHLALFKVCSRCLKKNIAQTTTLFALSEPLDLTES
jgi:hypothetical protein